MRIARLMLHTVLVTGCLCVLLPSCKKDKTEPDNGLTGIPKIKTITKTSSYSTNTFVSSFQYDTQGRKTSSTTTKNGKLYFTDTIVYTASSIVETITDSTNSTKRTYVSYDKGQLIHATETYSDSKIHHDIWYVTDSAGFCTNADSLIIEKGNRIKITYYTYYIYYSYYLDKTNTIGTKNQGIGFLGNQDKNLIKTSTDQNKTVIDYSYEFDSKGRVSKQIVTYHPYGYTDTSTYTYVE